MIILTIKEIYKTLFLSKISFMKIILNLSAFLIIFSCSSSKTTLTEKGLVGNGILVNNLKQGKWTFYKNEKLYSTGKFSKGKKIGYWKDYHPNGKLFQKGKFKNDFQNGIWNYYYESGEFMGKGELIYDKQNGLWKWFHKNGKLYTERLYENGKLMEIKSCFDEDENVLDCGKIFNGNGIMIYHNLENSTKILEKVEYIDGLRKK